MHIVNYIRNSYDRASARRHDLQRVSGLVALCLTLVVSSVQAQTAVTVTFKVDVTGIEIQDGVYITGSFTGPEGQWLLLPMTAQGNGIHSYTTELNPGAEGAYYFLRGNDWSLREWVPAECALMWDVDRKYTIPAADVTYAFRYSSCEATTAP